MIADAAAPGPNAARHRAAQRRWPIALALLGLVAAVFHPVREHDFVHYDDDFYITENPQLRSGLSVENLKRAFTEPYGANWIPLTTLSFQLNHALHGIEPAGFLLTNAVLHGLATLLLFAALARMTRATWPSAFVAAVFAIHPLHVESVAWAAERKDVLAGLFWMLAMLAWARYAERPSFGRYALVALCLALGLLSKPIVVTLPFALLLLDYWPLRRLAPAGADAPWPIDRSRLARALLEKLPLLGLVAATSAITVIIYVRAGEIRHSDVLPLDDRLANAAVAYVIYLAQSAWPDDLAVFYPHPWGRLPGWQVAGSAALLALLSALALRWARTRPYLAVGWLWYLGTLVPVIGVVQIGLQAHADRYMYLPLVGLALALAWGVADGVSGRRRARSLCAVAGAAAIAGLALAAAQQLKTWRDAQALFEHAIAVTDDNFLAHKNLADALLQRGRAEQAELHYREALRIWPDWTDAQLGRANLLAAQGRIGEALAHYAEIARREPDDPRAAGHYGLALLRAGRFSEARDQLERALAGHAGVAELHAGMALASSQLGDFERAVRHGREALRLDATLASAANNLAWILATSPDPRARDPEEAIRIMRRLLGGAQRASSAHLDTLAAAYAAAGRFPEAIETAARAEALAREARRWEEAEQIRARLARYRAGEPWIERPDAAAAER